MRHFVFSPAVAVPLTAGFLFCTLFSLPARAEDRKQTLTQQQNQAQQAYETAQNELEAIQQQQTQTESQIQALKGQTAALASQIEALTKALQEADRQLLECQNNAAQAAQALAEKRAEYDNCRERCKQQLCAMQLLDGGGAVGLLAQAKSLYQLLTFTDTLQQLSAGNQKILQQLHAEADALEISWQAAEDAARQAEQAKNALDAQQTQLQDTQGQLQTALQQANETLDAQQAAEQAQAVATEAAKKAFEEATAALDAYVRAQSDQYTTADLVLTSLDFRCPLDSYSRITTRYGEADPWGIPHRGTDFAAANGTPIYAIAAGVISAAEPVNSYGNCAQISHGTASDGNRYDSLYAHMSSIAVHQGQAVEKGQVIGYVGNTGNVYGANGGYHLHLELRINGGRTDPLRYVPS